jgi:hypothetical protein
MKRRAPKLSFFFWILNTLIQAGARIKEIKLCQQYRERVLSDRIRKNHQASEDFEPLEEF